MSDNAELKSEHFEQVIQQSLTRGLAVSQDSILPLGSTGFMSKVYEGKMNDGDVVINMVKNPVPEQIFQCVPQKIYYVSSLLKNIEQVPHIYLQGTFAEKGYFIIQEKKSGIPLGARSYENKKFIDTVLVENPNHYLEELQDIILEIHSPISETFGYPTSKKNVVAQTGTWEEFLIQNSERCINTLVKAEGESNISYFSDISPSELLLKLKGLINTFPDNFATQRAHLIHGDIFNYSNVLVDNGKISAIVDFEWSLWAHPAWEFVFTENPRFERYLPKALEEGILSEKIDFKKSVELHTIFWCLWGTSVHANNPEFGPALFQVMQDKLSQV